MSDFLSTFDCVSEMKSKMKSLVHGYDHASMVFHELEENTKEEKMAFRVDNSPDLSQIISLVSFFICLKCI